MNIQNNLQQLEITYREINEARLKIKAAAASEIRVAGKFSAQADRALSLILTQMADQIRLERQKVIVAQLPEPDKKAA